MIELYVVRFFSLDLTVRNVLKTSRALRDIYMENALTSIRLDGLLNVIMQVMKRAFYGAPLALTLPYGKEFLRNVTLMTEGQCTYCTYCVPTVLI